MLCAIGAKAIEGMGDMYFGDILELSFHDTVLRDALLLLRVNRLSAARPPPKRMLA